MKTSKTKTDLANWLVNYFYCEITDTYNEDGEKMTKDEAFKMHMRKTKDELIEEVYNNSKEGQEFLA